MKAENIHIAGGRRITLIPFSETVDCDMPRPFVALLPADNADDCRLAETVIGTLIRLGCLEVCCVGPAAEQMHDQLDAFIEASGSFEIVTTWFNDGDEACEYALFAAGGGRLPLLAAALGRTELVNKVKESSR